MPGENLEETSCIDGSAREASLPASVVGKDELIERQAEAYEGKTSPEGEMTTLYERAGARRTSTVKPGGGALGKEPATAGLA